MICSSFRLLFEFGFIWFPGMEIENKLYLLAIITHIDTKFGPSCYKLWDLGIHTDGGPDGRGYIDSAVDAD